MANPRYPPKISINNLMGIINERKLVTLGPNYKTEEERPNGRLELMVNRAVITEAKTNEASAYLLFVEYDANNLLPTGRVQPIDNKYGIISLNTPTTIRGRETTAVNSYTIDTSSEILLRAYNAQLKQKEKTKAAKRGYIQY